MAAENVRLIYLREAGAEHCPEESAVKRAVATRLGYDPFVESGARRTVRAVLAPKGRWLAATIELSDEHGDPLGTNQLMPKVRDCDTLASAVELAIALAIDPLSATAPREAPRAAEPSPSPSAPPETVAAPVLTVRRRAPPPVYYRYNEEPDNQLHLVGRIAILGAVASEAAATWGIELGLAAQWRRFSVGAELRGDVPGARITQGGSVASSLLVVNFLPCVRAYGVYFCGLLSTGVVIAYGAEFAVDHRVALPYAGGGARAGVEFKLNRRLAIGLHADLVAPFTHTILTVDQQDVFRAEPVSGAFAAVVSGVLK